MAHPDDDVLAALALGEDVPSDVREHVASCDECGTAVAELRSLVALAGGDTVQWQEPPAAVWSEISASLSPPSLSPRSRSTRRSWSRRVAAGLAVAAVGAVIGLGAGRAVWHSPAPASTVVGSAALDTLDTGRTAGSAKVLDTGGAMTLRIDTTESLDPGDGYLEVWLLNKDGKRMVSVGVLQAPGVETFPMSASLVEHGYTIVDISKESYDDNPAHSGDSLLRGKLTV